VIIDEDILPSSSALPNLENYLLFRARPNHKPSVRGTSYDLSTLPRWLAE